MSKLDVNEIVKIYFVLMLLHQGIYKKGNINSPFLVSFIKAIQLTIMLNAPFHRTKASLFICPCEHIYLCYHRSS